MERKKNQGHYGTDCAYRDHILRDLQPYMCTYTECTESNAMYSSKSSWLEHESRTHRMVWRCFEHKDLFRSKEALVKHLETSHSTLSTVQIQHMAGLAHASTTDERKECPFCLSSGPFEASLPDHMALHMERLASFSVTRHTGEEDEAAGGSNSGAAQGDRSMSSLRDVSLDFSDVGSTIPSTNDITSPQVENPIDQKTQEETQEKIEASSPNLVFSVNDDDSAYHHYLDQRFPGTCQWFLDSADHQTWLSRTGERRLVLGVPGVGKSVLASVVLEDLRNRFSGDTSVGVVGLFCEVYARQEEIMGKVYRSLKQQLDHPAPVESHISTFDAICKYIASAASRLSRIFLVIDGLDTSVADFDRLLLEINHSHPEVSLLFTSRILPSIEDALPGFSVQELRATDVDLSTSLRKSFDNIIMDDTHPTTMEETIQGGVIFADGM